MTPSNPLHDPAMKAIQPTLEALTDEELEDAMGMRISFKPECPAETRRGYAMRQGLMREILESRRLSRSVRQ